MSAMGLHPCKGDDLGPVTSAGEKTMPVVIPDDRPAPKQLKPAFLLDKKVEEVLAKFTKSALEKARAQFEVNEAIQHDLAKFQSKSRAKAAALKASQTSQLPTDIQRKLLQIQRSLASD